MKATGVLKLAQRGQIEDLKFALNPAEVRYSYSTQYAQSLASLTDYGGSYNGPRPLEWVRNPPDQITFELVLYADSPDKADAVEDDIKKLRGFMRKEARSGEPPDLIFRYGAQPLVKCRLVKLGLIPVLMTEDLKMQHAKASIELQVQQVF